MPTRSVLMVVGAFVAASASVPAAAADARQAVAAGSSPAWFQPKSPISPYSQLFKPPSAESVGRQVMEQEPAADGAPLTTPTVACGMLMIPADASVDPRMRVGPSRTDNVTYTIRAVKPPVCRPR